MPYKEYFENASEGLVVVRSSGEIVEVNHKVELLFGYSKKELVGALIEILVPERFRARHQAYLAHYFAEPRSRPMGVGLQLAARRKDSSEFPVEISLTYAPRTERGDLVVAAITDISERLVLERELRRSETVVSLGTLAAGIAHDLNNPLQVIRSTAELLLDLPDTPGELSADYQTILRQAQRASAIVEEFLALSRRRGNNYGRLNLTRWSITFFCCSESRCEGPVSESKAPWTAACRK